MAYLFLPKLGGVIMAQIYKKQGSWAFRVYYKDDQGKRK